MLTNDANIRSIIIISNFLSLAYQFYVRTQNHERLHMCKTYIVFILSEVLYDPLFLQKAISLHSNILYQVPNSKQRGKYY